MTYPATTPDEAFRACNPNQPLTADDPRYVDLEESRGTKQIAKTITRSIKRSDQALQLLFTGHRGSGKTTELLRLKQELESNDYFTVYLDVEEVLDLGSISHLDVLLAIAKQIQESLYKAQIPISDTLLDDISSWFSDHIVEDSTVIAEKATLSSTVQAGVKLPFFKLLAKLTGEIKAASSRRDIIRENLKREISIFISKLNILIENAQQNIQNKGFKDLIMIVDGLEKMHYEINPDGQSTHTALFVRHAEQLKAPACHIIYTVPISLVYNQNLGADFDRIYVLPMVHTNGKGIEQLMYLIQQRLDINIIFKSPDLVQRLIEVSGGVVRDLMRLIIISLETDNVVINNEDVDYAINSLRKEYSRLILSTDLAKLKIVDSDKEIHGDEDSARLLNLRLVLEYENGKRCAALHPIIKEIGSVKKALSNISHD